MSIFSKLFSKKQAEGEENAKVGGMEDFMTLIRVYYQSVMACNIGITILIFCLTWQFSNVHLKSRPKTIN